ncbi:hypothetical protein BpHYR1_034104 [Brachionus plicatilis]|uniref:Uncharacterized protein n=1 Tax=Brachionus plicatilis TaxID=10195 RepID=A0A3M7PLB6_BRAPC|nr:hypothetical protein BpHYR1_034104 [Brachionus plicatilis]
MKKIILSKKVWVSDLSLEKIIKTIVTERRKRRKNNFVKATSNYKKWAYFLTRIESYFKQKFK